MAASITEAAAVNPKGTEILSANGVRTFFINGKRTNINVFRNLRNPPSWLIIFLVVLFKKIPLFSKDLPTRQNYVPRAS